MKNVQSHCTICKKPLSDFTSVKIGMGPICRARLFYQEKLQGKLFNDHAVFRIEDETSTYIYISDRWNNCKTVTNDVEWVLCELESLCDIENKRIFYMDSEGRIDEILHRGKTFIDFKAGHLGVEL
jgi:hypothetical protein